MSDTIRKTEDTSVSRERSLGSVNVSPSDPLWVCVDCYQVLCNGEAPDDDYRGDPDCEPLSLLSATDISPGMMYEFHECGKEYVKDGRYHTTTDIHTDLVDALPPGDYVAIVDHDGYVDMAYIDGQVLADVVVTALNAHHAETMASAECDCERREFSTHECSGF